MTARDRVQELFARYVEHHVLHGARLDPVDLCEGFPELVEPLRELIRHYRHLDETLTGPLSEMPEQTPGIPEPAEPLPTFEGFRTIERLGAGGGGEVYKLEDLQLGRIVAAKVIRPDRALQATLGDFLDEARSLALFEDPGVVRIFEFRGQADPPVLLMEFVDGFELTHVGRSLECSQRVRVMIDIAETIHRAHNLGIQHRDLKPANIMLDAQLIPKILDFGLSRGDPHEGHGVGTLAYMAPEQFDPSRPIGPHTDVYALGVILYELLCGALPYESQTQEQWIASIESGEPRLPVEIEPDVPEPLQAIALKAMARDPVDRYTSAREMALDLKRYLDGKPVTARPVVYRSALTRRLRPHVEQIREWLRIKLIFPHEADGLTRAYRRLEAREDDWIAESRSLSLSKITLYMGAFLLSCGGLLYFVAYLLDAVDGLAKPLLILGLPFLGLNAAAHLLFRREQKAVAVAFYLGAVILLPLLLLIMFDQAGIWAGDPDNHRELFGDGAVSNRRLQVATLVACGWSCWLALRTCTGALSACFTVAAFVFNLAVLADLDLRLWLEDGRWDLLAFHLLPFLAITMVLGRLGETRQRFWFARPLYFTGAGLFVLVLELLALDGKSLEYLGVSLAGLHGADTGSPILLDTVGAMTVNGLAIYCAGRLLEEYGSALLKTTASFLYIISPFAILEPLAYLNNAGDYSRRFDWLYLGLALTIAFLSHFRQRKSFYYAGLLNTGAAMWFITRHYEWFDRPAWAVAILAIGLTVLVSGFGLHTRERRRIV